MNILIPDSWLRDFLKTKATPAQLQEYLSLCGPSVERINVINNETVYDIEVTTNRIDSMSVNGIAREAAAILPEFTVKATYLPPEIPTVANIQGTKPLGIMIKNDPSLCYRILAIKLENVHLGESPKWLKDRLELVGQRPLNNIIDITNYVMWEMGHPIHAFDYDRLTNKKIIVREAKKGERLTTLDNKTHTLKGGEIIFDDGTGRIIDLPGIMGTENTVITEKTKNVMLFIENSDPAKIRYAPMGLAIRTQAAVLNEKGPDPAIALQTLLRATAFAKEIAGATVASKLVDIYPHPQIQKTVILEQSRLDTYLGLPLPKLRIKRILETLGCKVNEKTGIYSITPPTWRTNDIQIPEDAIEEISRIYGYHNILPKLPDTAPPVVSPEKDLLWEEEIKIRLRDWGYTELYTYSMISEKLMDIFKLDKTKAYKISNPLSEEWVYMRPHLFPSVLNVVKQNLNIRKDLRLFELSMVYQYRENDLPREVPTLIVVWTGADKFLYAKGLADAILSLFGLKILNDSSDSTNQLSDIYSKKHITLGKYGSYGEVNDNLISRIGIQVPVTRLYLNFEELVNNAKSINKYTPIPKYPPVIEDLTFTVSSDTYVGTMISTLKRINPLIQSIEPLDVYKDNRTFRITYMDPDKTLTADEVRPIREKLIATAENEFGAIFKTV
jgi:phenylalanyl-tRNA synthetase beta chain